MPLSIQGLYAVTDGTLIPEHCFSYNVEQAIIGGARVVQYRDKNTNKLRKLEQAQSLLKLCRHYGVPFIINDDVTLAKQIGADGVHLGQEDSSILIAREVLGDKAIIGASCYNQLSLAERAVIDGANYIAFGSVFPSRIKPRAVAAPLTLLQQARALFSCPIVAIGGITPENAPSVLDTGVDAVAVVYGIFGQRDIFLAAQRYAKLFTPKS
jgi:thiamine-phosphate pyrophosphorylase